MKSKVLKKLIKLSESDPAFIPWLTYQMNFKSTGAIRQWIKRESIPRFAESYLDDILEDLNARGYDGRRAKA